MKNVAYVNGKSILGAVGVGDGDVRSHVEGVVLRTVEDVLNALPEAEADEICRASRYQRSPDRRDTRAGSYKRRLLTKAGEVVLRVPRLRTLPFTTRIIERYKTRRSTVEASLLEMYLSGVSVRRTKNITAALCPYVFVDGICLKKSRGGEVQDVSVPVAVGVDEAGCREILGVAEGGREDKESWRNFLRYLKGRGLSGVKLIVSDKCLGLHGIIGDLFLEAKWQRRTVHWYRNIASECPRETHRRRDGDSRSGRQAGRRPWWRKNCGP